MAHPQFPHLPLLLRFRGSAKIQGGGTVTTQTTTNRSTPARHSNTLKASAVAAGASWQARQAVRQGQGLPVLPAGMPLLLQVDPNIELDVLREKFGFEIVSEQEDGFVIVATKDVQLSAFLQ